MNRIEEALQRLFEKNRIVFWYDGKKELEDQFQSFSLPGVQKLEVTNDEFSIKHQLLVEKPEDKFLLYFKHEQPELIDNWLLDLELSNFVFHTDQEALFLQELELPMHLKEIVQQHVEFFRSKERRQKLKELITPEEGEDELRTKMLAVVFGTANISSLSFLQAHIHALAEGNDSIEKELERFKLQDHYWNAIAKKYNYQSEEPGIYDFLIEVFTANSSIGKSSRVNKESRILLSLWKDKISHQEAFKTLSDKIASDLQIEETLQNLPLEELLNDDLFRMTDQIVISKLVEQLSAERISPEKVLNTIKKRENKYWYTEHINFYRAIRNVAMLAEFIEQHSSIKLTTFNEGINAYAEDLYKADQYYRKFIFEYRQSKQNRVLEPLAKWVEKAYSNRWLLSLNDQWQTIIDGIEKWDYANLKSQRQFFARYVKPFIAKKQRLFVIISDGFRYECGEEYANLMKAENRYESELEYLFTGIPSYTQLGMAALLPHKDLQISEGSGSVSNNGLPATGIVGRTKILMELSGVKATAINAEDFMKLNAATDGRDFVKQFDLIYIFHNRIDKTGDEKTTEEKVFDAANEEILFLYDIIKKISNMNGNNMLVTSDHGFIYQNSKLGESDFSVAEIKGDIWEESRRYAIGKNLQEDKHTTHFIASQLGLKGDAEVLIPKSINRLRKKGSGARYVHGGASLQEIVIPVIRINKKRQDTTRKVEVDIIKSTDKITTNILVVSFLQTELANNTVLPRTIRAGLHADNGELISDQFTYQFDASEGSERQREVKQVFHISNKAREKYKSQRVKLILEEPVEGSTQWVVYKEFLYTINIGIANEFDTW